jgi:sigma-B regulation protein RsbU (phosphoserine phosphatase)
MILGPTPSASYSIRIAEMQPGDLLVLYTDGITEAQATTSREEYGEDRLAHVVRAARHQDPVAIVDRVFSDITEYSRATPPADDQTIVVVKRRPQEQEETPA